MASAPAPVIVRPRRVMKLDLLMRIAKASGHCGWPGALNEYVFRGKRGISFDRDTVGFVCACRRVFLNEQLLVIGSGLYPNCVPGLSGVDSRLDGGKTGRLAVAGRIGVVDVENASLLLRGRRCDKQSRDARKDKK